MRNLLNKSKNPKMLILGEELDQETFPVLYKQALANREALENQVRSIWQKLWDGDPRAVGSALVMSEQDSQREKNLLPED